jgi:hypothetical protein
MNLHKLSARTTSKTADTLQLEINTLKNLGAGGVVKFTAP